jgi:glutamate-1-semialdehyde 2,1-aminomutase
VTIGKAVAGGLPMGAYGVTAELGEQLDAARNVATGGTLFGNPLSAAAAKAALTEVLVPDAYAHTSAWAASSPTGSNRQSARPGCHGQ